MAPKLSNVLEAVRPEAMADLLSGGLLPVGPALQADGVRLEGTRLHAPVCFWAVYLVDLNGAAAGPLRLTVKTFFDDSVFSHYCQLLREQQGERVGNLLHPQGGIALVPDQAAVLWSLPYDPGLPGLARATESSIVAPRWRWSATLRK